MENREGENKQKKIKSDSQVFVMDAGNSPCQGKEGVQYVGNLILRHTYSQVGASFWSDSLSNAVTSDIHISLQKPKKKTEI